LLVVSALRRHPLPALQPILETLDSFFLSAVVTAEKLAFSFEPMTDNAASARAAFGGHRLNCALETVERHCPAVPRYLKRFIVVVTASVTFGYCALPSLRLLHSNLLLRVAIGDLFDGTASRLRDE
jgi:hypothetical protein